MTWNWIREKIEQARERDVQKVTDAILDEAACDCSPLQLERFRKDGNPSTFFVDHVRGGLRCERCNGYIVRATILG